MVFPVFWMISTAFKAERADRLVDADVVPAASDAPALPATR